MSTDLGHDLPDWRTILEPVYLQHEDGAAPAEFYHPYIRRGLDKPKISAEEEYRLMVKQVKESQGFDIDFTKFRCIFNYEPVNFDNNALALKPETTRELMDRLSRESLERYNERKETKYEFVKVLKANHHMSAGVMFYITFKGKLPCSDDDKSNIFQAKVCYCGEITTDYLSCQLKPEKI